MYVQFTSCVYWDVTVCHECFKKVSRVTKNEDIIFHTISLYDCQFGKILITTGVKPLIWSPSLTEYLGLISQNFITALSNASINFLKAYNWLFIFFWGIPTVEKKKVATVLLKVEIFVRESLVSVDDQWDYLKRTEKVSINTMYGKKPAGTYLFKVYNGNTRTICEICEIKVNNKDSKTTSLTSFGCLYCWL